MVLLTNSPQERKRRNNAEKNGFHLHVHVIPRYIGDVADPRGGIRRLTLS
ncbi:MAG: hypothetical protein PHV50_01075 [Syntrophaceticus sp.]|nr:hypothetical protein [Syntrophaceticus sp.]MDD4359143.1 hypothetical protein [Syntrophaceticus sp.]